MESRKLQDAAAEAKAAETAREAGAESPYDTERNAVNTEAAKTETAADEAGTAVAEAEKFAAAQGENVDSESKNEIAAAGAEMAEAAAELEAVKAELPQVDAEASAEDAGAAETPAEAVAEVPAEAPAEAPAETEEMQEINNEQAVELANKMESLSKNLHDAKTAEEVETAFQAIADQIDQMKGIKFPDKITTEQGGEIAESGKEIEDDIKSGKALESFKLSRDIRLQDIKSAQESTEAPAEIPSEKAETTTESISEALMGEEEKFASTYTEALATKKAFREKVAELKAKGSSEKEMYQDQEFLRLKEADSEETKKISDQEDLLNKK